MSKKKDRTVLYVGGIAAVLFWLSQWRPTLPPSAAKPRPKLPTRKYGYGGGGATGTW